MMQFVFFLDAAQNADGVFNRRFLHNNRLKAPRQRCVLFDVRTCTMTSGMGPAGLSHCAAAPGHAAACGAAAKHKAWDAPCQEMGYDFVALPMETGGRQSEEEEQFLDRLVKFAGSGDSSDEARFRHFAATSLMMTK